jgi:signal transduction histidine kinase
MSRSRLSPLLSALFLALLGWYLVYSQQIVRAFRADATTMTQIFAEVQSGLQDPDPGRANLALVRLQDLILGVGVPLVLVGEGDTILAAVNLPFSVDLSQIEGQERVRQYKNRLALRNPPVGDPELGIIFFGDPPELQRLRWIPWLQASGLLLTFLLGVTVIRAQRRAEADRAWTAMARELAHQLGTPISSLQGWLEVLRLPAAERPRELMDDAIAIEIGEDVERLERVSRRFELVGREPPLEVVELTQVLGAVERYLRARIPRLGPGVQLEVVCPPELPPIRGSAVLLSWALENIVKNALDALAGRGGRIELRAHATEPGMVTLEVADNGPGIHPAIRDRLFDPGETTKASGWGVGLSLSQRIVERIHGGTLKVARTGPEGTVFELRIPRAAGSTGAAGSQPKPS